MVFNCLYCGIQFVTRPIFTSLHPQAKPHIKKSCKSKRSVGDITIFILCTLSVQFWCSAFLLHGYHHPHRLSAKVTFEPRWPRSQLVKRAANTPAVTCDMWHLLPADLPAHLPDINHPARQVSWWWKISRVLSTNLPLLSIPLHKSVVSHVCDQKLLFFSSSH